MSELALDAAEATWSVEVQEQPLVAPPHSRLVMLQKHPTEGAASFRALRQQVLSQWDAPGSLLITSARAGEGKTTCAANLALALAELGRAEVLLLEAHAQSPGLAALFGISDPHDWVQAVREADAQEPPALGVACKGHHLEGHTLSLLAMPAKPSEARLSLGQWRRLLSGLLGVYDHVVIDGPPVLSSAEAAVLAEAVDAVLLVAAAGRTRATALKQALAQMPATKRLGTVISRR